VAPSRRARLLLFALCSSALVLAGTAFLLTGRTAAVRKGPAPATPRAQLLSEGRPAAAQLARAVRRAGAREGLAEDLPPGGGPALPVAADRRAVAIAARAFLRAFSAYEVGDLSPRTRAQLQAFATPEFARRLLDSPPLPPADRTVPPAARNPRFEVVPRPDTDGTPRAQVSGSARRGWRSEPFSFEFERHGEAWLAAGIGE
jgi:hypothetical protein